MYEEFERYKDINEVVIHRIGMLEGRDAVLYVSLMTIMLGCWKLNWMTYP